MLVLPEKGEQNELRGDGLLPVIHVEGETLAEAARSAILACWDCGARVETPKHQKGGSLGYDADIIVRVKNPLAEPKIYFPALYDDGRGVMQYILEVTHGIHNHWKKNPNDPNDERWGYTYNERFVDQLPFVFQRIKADWEKTKKKEGKGRITGRDYQFSIWRAGEDIILEQEDPPCWQRGHLRFLMNDRGEIVFNYITDWRSRDLLKAWNENIIGQIELMKLLRDKISDMLGVDVKMGAYIDRSSSLHLYGLYADRDNLNKQIEIIKANPYPAKTMSLDDYLLDRDGLKKLVYAQTLAEDAGHGKNLGIDELKKLNYDIETIKYPKEWDSWPKSWDAEPNARKLARVYS